MISIAPAAFASSPASVEVDPTGQAAERRQTSRDSSRGTHEVDFDGTQVEND
jgi:hypothetical protein